MSRPLTEAIEGAGAGGVRTIEVARAGRRPASRRRSTDLLRVLLVGAVVAAGIVGYATFRIWGQGYTDEARPADAIVVLGAAQYDGTPSPVFQARIDHAVQLWKDGLAPWFVVTGGSAAGDRVTEASAARTYAIEQGVPMASIMGENRGTNTLGSMRALQQLFRENGIRSAIFVSDRGHMLRVLRLASDLGIEAYGSPTEDSPTDATLVSRARATLHELGALGWYFLANEERPGG